MSSWKTQPWDFVRIGTDLTPYVTIAGVSTSPESHLCHPEVQKILDLGRKGKQQMTLARGWLTAINPYEALHVRCDFVPRPVCPVCGTYQEPRPNPCIAHLIEIYEGSTQGWNPLHKGFLLCDLCAKRYK